MSLVRCFNIEIMRLMQELLIYLERWESFVEQGYCFSTKDSNQELGPWFHFCSHLHKRLCCYFSLFIPLLPWLQRDRLPHSSVLNCNEVHPVNSTLIMSALSAPHWFFYLIRMSVLHTGISAYHMYAWCLQRPQEGIGFPGIGVTDGCKPLQERRELNPGPLRCFEPLDHLSSPLPFYGS